MIVYIGYWVKNFVSNYLLKKIISNIKGIKNKN